MTKDKPDSLGAASIINTQKRCILKLGYKCNNKCVFCHSQEHKLSQWLTLDEIGQRLDGIWEAGFSEVLFSGGEPTIHPNFLEVARLCGKAGRTFGLITNARMLSQGTFMSELVANGLSYVYLSLHGRAPVHDAITQTPGSYAQTWRAIRALAGLEGIETTVNAVVTSRNLLEIPVLVRGFSSFPRNIRLKFSLVEPRGAALDQAALHPHPKIAAEAVHTAIEALNHLGGTPGRLGVDGFPHCLSPWFRFLQNDMYTHRIVALQELADSTLYAVDYNNMRKPEVCRGCLWGDECRCTWGGTLDLFGDDWLEPVRGFMPNSFNYLPVPGEHDAAGTSAVSPEPVAFRKPAALRKTVALRKPADGANLLKARGAGPRDIRSILVDLGDGPRPYHTDTGDFSDAQLSRIVESWGQLYAQADGALFLSDFAGQLRKLVPDESDPLVWKPVAEDLFLNADLPVRQLLDQVQGEVADIGCGPAYYFDRLLPGIRDGKTHYLGVDPSPGVAVAQAHQDGQISLQRCGVEDAVLAKNQFDWILVLRSHNHLFDLWTAYRRIVGALKWGGRLLVVDNVSFGLVRPALAKSELDSIPPGTGLEHLRDHDDRMALRFLSRFPLRPLSIHHLGPTTANQWVLLFEKAWPSGGFGEEGFG